MLTVAWQLQDAEFRHPRFVDTSLQIHRQWKRGQVRAFPSVAAAPDLVVRVSRLWHGKTSPLQNKNPARFPGDVIALNAGTVRNCCLYNLRDHNLGAKTLTLDFTEVLMYYFNTRGGTVI